MKRIEENHETQQNRAEEKEERATQRRPYQAPRVIKKRSVSRVTLFSGGGATAGGLTASG